MGPSLYYTHEWPDLFKIGDWWYLVYSTFTERCVTHYRMSKTLRGPLLAPENDVFDGRAFYAAKTCSDGRRRFLFGWNPTREQEKDYGVWQWGGNLIAHETMQEPDGSLSVKVPEAVDKTFSKSIPVKFSPGIGRWEISRNLLSVDAPDSFACAMAQKMPRCCKISAVVTFGEHTRGCGIMLRVSEDLDHAYYVRFEPGRNRVVFDSWPRAFRDRPYWIGLETPIGLAPNRQYELGVFVDGTVCEIYAAGEVAMSTRLYDLKRGRWGVFANEGTSSFGDLSLEMSVS